MEKILNKIYFELDSTSTIGSVKKNFEKARKIDGRITIKNIRDLLKKKDGYTLHVVKTKKFKRRKFLVRKAGDIVFSDVIYIKTLVKSKQYGYIMKFIDGLSRYGSAYPLKNLKSKTVIPVLSHFFKLCLCNSKVWQ